MEETKPEATVEALLYRLCAAVSLHKKDLKIVTNHGGERLTRLSIECHRADYPRLVGKRGARFHALRLIVELIGIKIHKTLELVTVVEPTKGELEKLPPFKFNAHWPREEIAKLLEDTCTATLVQNFRTYVRESGKGAVFTVEVAERESRSTKADLPIALNSIFNGIGAANGCIIAVDVKGE